MEQRIIVGISGATGVILARKLVEALTLAHHHVDLVISTAALYTASHELGRDFSTAKRFVAQFPDEVIDKVRLHGFTDIGSAISSGSYPVKAMVIVPCSMATVAALSVGLGDNCLRRAADVTLKEKRPLIIVPREAPLSTLHLENLLKLSRLGATILPPMPAWYNLPKSMSEMEDDIVGKIMDSLKIENSGLKKWKATSDADYACH